MRTKIRKGWYVSNGYHIVETERYGGDKVLDWIVVESPEEAYRIFHGNEIRTYKAVFNRLKDAVEWLESESKRHTADDIASFKRLSVIGLRQWKEEESGYPTREQLAHLRRLRYGTDAPHRSDAPVTAPADTP